MHSETITMLLPQNMQTFFKRFNVILLYIVIDLSVLKYDYQCNVEEYYNNVLSKHKLQKKKNIKEDD